MSKPLIQQYYNQLERSYDFSKTKNEETIKSYFWMLLNDYAHRQNYEVVREVFDCKSNMLYLCKVGNIGRIISTIMKRYPIKN